MRRMAASRSRPSAAPEGWRAPAAGGGRRARRAHPSGRTPTPTRAARRTSRLLRPGCAPPAGRTSRPRRRPAPRHPARSRTARSCSDRRPGQWPHVRCRAAVRSAGRVSPAAAAGPYRGGRARPVPATPAREASGRTRCRPAGRRRPRTSQLSSSPTDARLAQRSPCAGDSAVRRNRVRGVGCSRREAPGPARPARNPHLAPVGTGATIRNAARGRAMARAALCRDGQGEGEPLLRVDPGPLGAQVGRGQLGGQAARRNFAEVSVDSSSPSANAR